MRKQRFTEKNELNDVKGAAKAQKISIERFSNPDGLKSFLNTLKVIIDAYNGGDLGTEIDRAFYEDQDKKVLTLPKVVNACQHIAAAVNETGTDNIIKKMITPVLTHVVDNNGRPIDDNTYHEPIGKVLTGIPQINNGEGLPMYPYKCTLCGATFALPVSIQDLMSENGEKCLRDMVYMGYSAVEITLTDVTPNDDSDSKGLLKLIALNGNISRSVSPELKAQAEDEDVFSKVSRMLFRLLINISDKRISDSFGSILDSSYMGPESVPNGFNGDMNTPIGAMSSSLKHQEESIFSSWGVNNWNQGNQTSSNPWNIPTDNVKDIVKK